jgi:hypothetical protein
MKSAASSAYSSGLSQPECYYRFLWARLSKACPITEVGCVHSRPAPAIYFARMLLPQSYGAALSLIVLTMLCWGSWANTFKLAGKWRFELFYYDYSLGVLIAASIYALNFGNLGHDGLAFSDDLMHSGSRQIFFGALGGGACNWAIAMSTTRFSNPKCTTTALLLFGVSFGYFEAAAASYLGAVYEPMRKRLFPGSSPSDVFPLLRLEQLQASGPDYPRLLRAELAREFATLVMLAASALAVGRSGGQWLAAFWLCSVLGTCLSTLF